MEMNYCDHLIHDVTIGTDALTINDKKLTCTEEELALCVRIQKTALAIIEKGEIEEPIIYCILFKRNYPSCQSASFSFEIKRDAVLQAEKTPKLRGEVQALLDRIFPNG